MKKILRVLFIFSMFCLTYGFCEETSNIAINQDIAQMENIDNTLDNTQAPDTFQRPYQPEYKPAFLKMFLILFALLVLVFLTFWIIKRMMGVRLHQANLTKNIKILEKRAVSPKSLLYLIEVDGKRFVISESNLEVRKIKDLD